MKTKRRKKYKKYKKKKTFRKKDYKKKTFKKKKFVNFKGKGLFFKKKSKKKEEAPHFASMISYHVETKPPGYYSMTTNVHEYQEFIILINEIERLNLKISILRLEIKYLHSKVSSTSEQIKNLKNLRDVNDESARDIVLNLDSDKKKIITDLESNLKQYNTDLINKQTEIRENNRIKQKLYEDMVEDYFTWYNDYKKQGHSLDA